MHKNSTFRKRWNYRELTDVTLRSCNIIKLCFLSVYKGWGLISTTVYIHMPNGSPLLSHNTLNRCGSDLREYFIMLPLKNCIVLLYLILSAQNSGRDLGQCWTQIASSRYDWENMERKLSKSKCLLPVNHKKNIGFGRIIALGDLSYYGTPGRALWLH